MPLAHFAPLHQVHLLGNKLKTVLLINLHMQTASKAWEQCVRCSVSSPSLALQQRKGELCIVHDSPLRALSYPLPLGDIESCHSRVNELLAWVWKGKTAKISPVHWIGQIMSFLTQDRGNPKHWRSEGTWCLVTLMATLRERANVRGHSWW